MPGFMVEADYFTGGAGVALMMQPSGEASLSEQSEDGIEDALQQVRI